MFELFHEAEFWFAVAFVLFIVAVWRTAAKMLATTLDGRAAKVRGELEEAKRLRDEAQALLESYRRKQEQAVKDAADIVESAKAEAERMRAEGEQALKRSLAAREAQAMDRIAQAEQAAVDEVRARTVDIAIRAAGGLMPDLIDQGRGKALMDDAIDNLPRRAKA